jgi:hypothetical protein
MVLINRCGMCKRDEESIDHLLFHCECAQFLWNAFFSRFGLVWAMPCGVVNLLQCWWTGGRSRSAVVWKMVPLCIMWCIWPKCNGRFFEDSERSLEDLLHFFLTALFTWAATWLAPLVITYFDFLFLFSSPLLGILLYTSCVLGLHPSVRFLYNITYPKNGLSMFGHALQYFVN